MLPTILCLLLLAPPGDPFQDPEVASFELVWSTLRNHYWDSKMAGRDWQAIHDSYRPLVSKAKDHEEAAAVLRRMIHELPSSHLAIIPAKLYRVPPGSAELKEDGGGKEDGDESADVGLEIIAIDNVLAVERVDADRSAGTNGVRPGWIIQSVEGLPSQEFLGLAPPGSLDDRRSFAQEILNRSLRGPHASKVTVVFRKPTREEVTCRLVRQVPAGELVEFSNLPPERAVVKHRLLEDGVGYIRLNVFLDPVRSCRKSTDP